MFESKSVVDLVKNNDGGGIKRLLDEYERVVMYSFGCGEVPEECIEVIEIIYSNPLCRGERRLGRMLLSLGTDPELMSVEQRVRIRDALWNGVRPELDEYLIDVAFDFVSRVFEVGFVFDFCVRAMSYSGWGVDAYVEMALNILKGEKKITDKELVEMRRAIFGGAV